eukprot:524770_1
MPAKTYKISALIIIIMLLLSSIAGYYSYHPYSSKTDIDAFIYEHNSVFIPQTDDIFMCANASAFVDANDGIFAVECEHIIADGGAIFSDGCESVLVGDASIEVYYIFGGQCDKIFIDENDIFGAQYDEVFTDEYYIFCEQCEEIFINEYDIFGRQYDEVFTDEYYFFGGQSDEVFTAECGIVFSDAIDEVCIAKYHNIYGGQYDEIYVFIINSDGSYSICKKAYSQSNYFNHPQYPVPTKSMPIKSRKRKGAENKENQPPHKRHRCMFPKKKSKKHRVNNLNKVNEQFRVQQLTRAKHKKWSPNDGSNVEESISSTFRRCTLGNNNNHNNLNDVDMKNDDSSDESDWALLDEAQGVIDKSTLAKYLHNRVLIYAPIHKISSLTYRQRQNDGITFDSRSLKGQKLSLTLKQSSNPSTISLPQSAMNKLSESYNVCYMHVLCVKLH